MTFRDRIKSDSGLMGPTHALSAVSLAFLISWVASDFMFGKVLGSTNIIVFISAIIIITGASLMPDLDAVTSTSINTLGIVGVLLSKAMRGFSTLVQSAIRTRGDGSPGDPHRGFWHTLLSAFLVGLIVSGLTSINTKLFTVAGNTVTVAIFVVIFIIYISLQLVLASLFKPFYKRTKNKLMGSIALQIGSLITALILMISLPAELNYRWVGAAVTLGWILHLLGDMMTVAGVPILFPIKYRGKRWWNFRFPLAIKAGGTIENAIVIPLFVIILVVSAINVIPLFI